jgi:hypothetical protein
MPVKFERFAVDHLADLILTGVPRNEASRSLMLRSALQGDALASPMHASQRTRPEINAPPAVSILRRNVGNSGRQDDEVSIDTNVDFPIDRTSS